MQNPTGQNPVTVAVTPLPDEFDIHKVAEVVRDKAVNFLDETELLKKHNLTKPQYDRIAKSEYFQQALKVAVADWAKPTSTEQRVAIMSALALELSLPLVTARMHGRNEPLTGVIEAAKFLAKCAGIGEENRGQKGAQERFTIHIDLGADAVLHVEKSRPTLELTAEEHYGKAADTSL
jgi:hypothetical protein